MMEMRYVELNEICDVRDGTHDSPKYVQEGFPLVTSKNIIDGKLDLSTVNYLTQKDYDKINERSKVDRGDIIMPMIGTIGNPLLIGDFYKFAIKNVALIKFPNKNISNRYIWYFLKSDAFNKYVAEKNRGGTQKFLSLNDIRRMKVPYISYFEQISVVEKLDMVYKVIMQRIKELQLLDDLIKARFVEMFGSIYDNKYGYNVMTLQDVCEPIKDGTPQTPTYTEDTVNGFKFLSSKDVTSGKVDWDHLKYIPEELHNELYKRISPRKGDILLAKNGTTGVAAIVDRDEVFDIYVSLALLKPLEMVTAEYLCSAVNSLETKHQFDHSLKGIGVPNLHLGEIKKTKIIVPPIELQKQFADFVHQVDKLQVVVQKALDETQILFNSLMQQYFG